MLDLMIPPIAAGLVILSIHVYLGLHVIVRGVIFIDLAFAQIAALGATVGLLMGVDHGTPLALAFSVGFTLVGALIFSFSRLEEDRCSPGGRDRHHLCGGFRCRDPDRRVHGGRCRAHRRNVDGDVDLGRVGRRSFAWPWSTRSSVRSTSYSESPSCRYPWEKPTVDRPVRGIFSSIRSSESSSRSRCR